MRPIPASLLDGLLIAWLHDDQRHAHTLTRVREEWEIKNRNRLRANALT